MNRDGQGLYGLMRGLIGLALGFYFRRIERFTSSVSPSMDRCFSPRTTRTL
jgi:hypothetical protein